MKIVSMEREVSHLINVAKYESIRPTVRVVATVEEGEDYAEVMEALHATVVGEFNLVALQELREVHKRRKGKKPDGDTLPELMSYYKSTL